MRKLFLAVLCLTLSAVAATADEKCTLVRNASLDVQIDAAGGVDVPIVVSGRPLMLLVDTGAVFSMLNQSVVDTLGLKLEYIPEAGLVLYGGTRITSYVTAYDVQLGKMKGPKADFLVMPNGHLPPGTDGILAPDFLSRFDADFDFANAKLNFFSHDHCDGRVVYWTHDAIAVVPFDMDEVRHIMFHVQLDGKDVKAIFDTGSSRSVMSLEAAEDLFGFDDATAKKYNGRYPFKELTLDGVTVNNPDVLLVPDDVSKVMRRAPPLILGMGVLRQLHLYIAYREHKLYITAASAH